MQQSIYNIIPKQYNPIIKGPLYKSKYPYNIPPTGSTFCHQTTSKPGISNLSGQFMTGLQAHTQYGQTQTFGHLKGDRKPSPQNFRKKHTGTMGNQSLPPIRNFSYDCKFKRAPVPTARQRPIHGLKSGKDFIVTNAIQNILSSANKRAKDPVDWLKKKDYGKNPQYLDHIKDNINNQYKMIQKLHQSGQEYKKILAEEEIQQLRDGLKQKWTQLNREYQKFAHIRLIDTVGLKRRKEGLQKELSQIQKDIKRLNKLYIFVQD